MIVVKNLFLINVISFIVAHNNPSYTPGEGRNKILSGILPFCYVLRFIIFLFLLSPNSYQTYISQIQLLLFPLSSQHPISCLSAL